MRGMTFYKYQGAGNDFLIADNRDGLAVLSSADISAICDRRYGVGADGVMLLEQSQNTSFMMKYYNSDGSGGMMCGNGGRCIAAFAVDSGVVDGCGCFEFEAADGMHAAAVLSDEGRSKVVRLKMKDVCCVARHDSLCGLAGDTGGYFLDTGTRHFVQFVDDVSAYDVVGRGRMIRFNAAEFQPVGTNVNFVGMADEVLQVRTYEKGVEDETFACGTGIVASCICAYLHGIPANESPDGSVGYDVRALRDRLSVGFVPHGSDVESFSASDVWLTGPAAYVAEIRF